jgi:hypothetical protein
MAALVSRGYAQHALYKLVYKLIVSSIKHVQ